MSWNGVSDSDICGGETPSVANRPIQQDTDLFTAAHPLSLGLLRGMRSYRTIRPHGRSDWLLFLTVAGNGLFRLQDKTLFARRHTAVLLLDGVAHDYGTAPDAPFWTFGFAHVSPRPLWRSLVRWPSASEGLLVVEIPDEETWRPAWAAMAEARRMLSSPVRGKLELAYNAVERCLLWCDEANPRLGPVADSRVRRAAECAARDLATPITVDAMAEAAGLSTSHLTALFRRQLGVSPARYAESLRLDHAARLLAAGGLSVKEAATASGYADPFHFSRRFTTRFGYPPSEHAGRGVRRHGPLVHAQGIVRL